MLVDTQPPAFPEPAIADLYDVGERDRTPRQTPNDFRQGIRHLARGVSVLTSSDEHDDRYGVTTTGVSVLSVEPPTMVVCVRRRSKLGTQLPRTMRFCVNVLSSRHRTLAEVFAGRKGVPADKFNHGRWTTGTSGSPVLVDALASFECEVDLLYGYPNHMIVVGRVQHVEHAAEQDEPLVYSSGELSSLIPSAAATTAPQ